jgi:hypothetical protein
MCINRLQRFLYASLRPKLVRGSAATIPGIVVVNDYITAGTDFVVKTCQGILR